MNKYNLNSNVTLHVYNTNKFKDISIYIGLLDNSNELDQTKRLLLSLMLEDSCSLYDTKEKVSNLLAKYYGARLSFFPDVKGNARIFEIKSSIINGKYVDDFELLENQFKLMNEFLFNPIWKSKDYPKKLFDEIKDRLKLIINSENDNPISYSNKKADYIFGNFLRVKSDYNIEKLDEIKINDIINLYNDLINNSLVDIFVVGDIDENTIYDLSLKYFKFEGRECSKTLVYKSFFDVYKEEIEERKINQTQIQLRYTTNKTSYDDFFSVIVGNGILGTLPTSLLFQEIREKRSLCYSIYSSVNGYDGVLKISTGINYKNIDEVKYLINEQINKIKSGDFSDEILDTTKKMYINAYRQGDDNVKSIIWDEYRNTLINDDLNLEKSIEKINNVSRESIMNEFKDVELKVCFILKQKEIDNEKN